MRFRMPLLDTRIETDLMVTFVLAPVWWFTGLSIFIYHLVVFIVFLKLIMINMRSNTPLRIPRSAVIFFCFLICNLASIVLNSGIRPAQRIAASFNNYAVMVMGFLLLLIVYNSEPRIFFKQFTRFCWYLCLISSGLGLFYISAWFAGYKSLMMTAWLGQKLPALLNYPFFWGLLMVNGIFIDWFRQNEIPRLTLYSLAPTATAGLALVYGPMALIFCRVSQKSKWIFFLTLIGSLFLIFFSMSRSAIYGLIGAIVCVWVLRMGKPFIFSFLAFLIAAISSGTLQRVIEWGLNMRRSSTEGRFALYQEALKVVKDENLLMGLGIRMRDTFTFEALGSHSHYIELLFVSGLLGLSVFIFFLFSIFSDWYTQRTLLVTKEDRIVWNYLGVSLISINVWLITDTIMAFPVIPFGYFLIHGSVLLLRRYLLEKARLSSENSI